MQKKQKQLSNYPVWFDGTNINEAAFCEEFLHTHKILFANNAFFTPEGRITDDLPLRGEITLCHQQRSTQSNKYSGSYETGSLCRGFSTESK